MHPQQNNWPTLADPRFLMKNILYSGTTWTMVQTFLLLLARVLLYPTPADILVLRKCNFMKRGIQLTAGSRYTTIFAAQMEAGGWPRFIPELQRRDADVGLKIVSTNVVAFQQPVNDPMFSAHRNFTFTLTEQTNRTIYIADSIASIMGCTMQVSLKLLLYCADRMSNDYTSISFVTRVPRANLARN